MKTLIAICSAYIMLVNIYTQDTQDNITAQKVIDNFIETSGGQENMENIFSIEKEGILFVKDNPYLLYTYFSKEWFFFYVKDKIVPSKVVADLVNVRGWKSVMGMRMDIPEKEIRQLKANAELLLFGFYTKKDEYSVEYVLKNSEIIDGKETYVIDFLVKGELFRTTYFDKTNFIPVKTISYRPYEEYSEYRNAGNSRLYLAHKIKSESDSIYVNYYKFNTEFDKSLLEDK